MNVNQWVDDRLATLGDGNDWQPEASLALARLRDLDRQAKVKRRWAWATAAAACLGLLLFVEPHACANPLGCTQDAAVRKGKATPVPQTDAARQYVVQNYKASGAADAPIAVEIYSDYECPSCAAFFHDTMPLLVAEYVKTGKVKLLHRDYPLQQHPYAKIAARYANAAGQAGQYDLAVGQIFQTQDLWSVSGDIEAQLVQVLPPAVMRKVRDMVEHDPRLDDTVVADQAMGARDRLQATPTVVVVSKGNRQTISPIPTYKLLKSYLDDLLARP
jgi:protein-disulfide isomerase